MDPILQNKNTISQLLAQSQSVGIIVSDKQNLDILAASLSLHLIFQDSGKNSQIVSRYAPTVEYSSLVGIDQLKENFGGVTKLLTVSFPYNDGDIEKVSYNIEGDRLNVNLFAEEKGIRFKEGDIRYIRQGSSPQLIFTVGIENPEALAGLTEPSTKIINIGNSVTNSLFGDVVLVDSSYSSLSEMVARMALDLSLQIEFDVAQNLLDGITSETNNFSSPKTSPTAFEMAGALMQKGAVRRDLKSAVHSQVTDTSLNMLTNKPFDSGAASSAQGAQGKPFGQKPFKQQFQNQPKTFDSSQGKPFGQTRNQQVSNKPNPPAGGQTQPRSNEPSQPRPIEDLTPAAQFDDANSNIPPEIPTEDQAPSDWFTPKVFKSNKN